MTIYIPDAYAFAELTQAPALAGSAGSVIQNYLTDFADTGRLAVTADTVTDLQSHMPQSPVTAWLRASRTVVVQGLSHYSHLDDVLRICPDLLNVNDAEMNPQVLVLALAMEKTNNGDTVTIVTGELADPPGRCGLANACVTAGVDFVDPSAFAQLLVVP